MQEPRAGERPIRAYVFLLVGVVAFSSSPILVRLAGVEASGLAIAVWRTVLAALGLLPFAVFRVSSEIRGFSRREVLFVAAAGVLLGLHFITWIESLYHTSVASATVIVSASPLFLAVLGYVLLQERLAWPTVAAIAVSVLGSVLIGIGDASSETFPRALYGNALSLIACLFVAGYLLIGRIVRRNTSWLGYVFPLYATVALTCLLVAGVRSEPLLGYSPRFYLLCALMAFGPQILGHGSLNYAVRYMPTALVGLTTLMEPVVASIVAYFLFLERPGLVAGTGMGIVLAAITFVFLPSLLRWRRRRT